MARAVSPSPAPASSRIVALDLLRGYLILVIASVHLAYYPSLLGAFDGRGQLWVSEAEGFFFISGLLIGIIRRRDVERSGLSTAIVKVLKRGWRLYSAGIVLTILYVLWGRSMLGIAPHSLKDGLDAVASWPSLLVRIVSMEYSYGWSDFLIFYAGFLFVAPLALWALRRGRWYWVVAATLGIWVWRWFGGYGPYNSFLQWQVYFFLGATLGYHWQTLNTKFDTLRPRLRVGLRAAAVAGFVLIEAVGLLAVFGPTSTHNKLLEWIGPLNASQWYGRLLVDGRIGLLRPLVLLVAFAGAYTLVRKYERQILKYVGWLLLPFGKNSLYVYILESLALFSIPFFLKPSGFVVNSLIEIVVAAFIWVAIRYKVLFNIIPR